MRRPAPAPSRPGRTLSNSGYNSSRIGFRGTEDLGGGLAASFWLEAPITNDDGATGISTFNRRSTVSLSGGFGELRLGRDDTPTFWNDTVFDPFGTNGSGTNVISSVNGSTGLNNTNYTRASNSIGYFLPPNLGGFYGQLQYSLHENTDSSTAADTASTNSNAGRYIGGRFGWANGPLDVAVSAGQNIAVDTLALTRKVQTINLGASYDFGPVKLFGELSNVQNKFDTALGNTHDSYNGYLIGATVPVGAGLIRASYSTVRYNEGAAGITGEDPRVQKLALGDGAQPVEAHRPVRHRRAREQPQRCGLHRQPEFGDHHGLQQQRRELHGPAALLHRLRLRRIRHAF